MTRSTAAVLVCAGAIGMGIIGHNQMTRYSQENVWARQKPVIEYVYHNNTSAKEASYATLRGIVDSWSAGQPASREQMCKDETKFNAIIRARGDEKKAETALSHSSFEPFAECKPEAELSNTATKWYSIAAMGAFLIGVIGLIRGRKE